MAELNDAAMRARQMYADGDKLADIYAATRLKYTKIYFWIDGADGDLPPIPRRRVPARGLGKTVSRRALVRRLMRLAEQQIEKVELRAAAANAKPNPEREGRAISVLARVVRDLITLDAANGSRALMREESKPNDEMFSPNVDQLRQQLIRSMDALVAERTGEMAGEDEPGAC